MHWVVESVFVVLRWLATSLACLPRPGLLTMRPGLLLMTTGAVEDIVTSHNYNATMAEGAATALRAGTDADCGSGYDALNISLAQVRRGPSGPSLGAFTRPPCGPSPPTSCLCLCVIVLG
jgi:hypothetical protein